MIEKKTVKCRKVRGGGAGENLKPALRSWISDVIVPVLVRDYVEMRKRKSVNQQQTHLLDSDVPNVRDCAEQQVATPGGLT
jgi:hypothetical protein